LSCLEIKRRAFYENLVANQLASTKGVTMGFLKLFARSAVLLTGSMLIIRHVV